MTPTELHAAAQAEADRFFGDAPAAPWQPGDARPVASPRPLVLGVVAAALAIGAALATSRLFAGAAPQAVAEALPRHLAVPPTREHASPTGDPDDDLIDEPSPPRPQAPVAPADVAQAAGNAQLAVTRHGRGWRIDAAGASRLLVAQRLADATGSSLRGDVSLLASTRPLDLHWQGRGAAQAWQAVLGQELSFLTQCSASRCQVWLLHAGADTAPALPPPRPQILLPGTEAIEVAAAPALRQADSTDPRVAAHHD